ncbi:MAG: hypothetical protein K0S01_3141 [Herbinix sp.]|jgi:hypothetical protein|nr:hypothetical protein [Herbinix sp.]
MDTRKNKIKGILFELIAATFYLGLLFVVAVIIMR